MGLSNIEEWIRVHTTINNNSNQNSAGQSTPATAGNTQPATANTTTVARVASMEVAKQQVVTPTVQAT